MVPHDAATPLLRRAAVLMYILGGLLALGGMLLGMGLIWRAPEADQIMDRDIQKFLETQKDLPPGVDAPRLKRIAIAIGVSLAVAAATAGVAQIALALAMRTGRRGVVLAGMIVGACVLLGLGFLLLTALIQVLGNPAALVVVVMLGVPSVLALMQMRLLVLALRLMGAGGRPMPPIPFAVQSSAPPPPGLHPAFMVPPGQPAVGEVDLFGPLPPP